MMAVVLSNNLLTVQLPKPSVVIGTGGDEVSRISTERTVPHPTLVASQRALELKWFWFRRFLIWTWDHLFEVLDFPDLCSVVRAAGGKMLDIRGKKNSGDVLPMSFKVGDWYQGRLFPVRNQMPDINISLDTVLE
jgi:hypothetical protein